MANEKRLILAEQAYEIARLHHHDFAKSLADLTSLREVLEDCDTVDAVEVVHAEWVWKDGCFHCTNCKQTEDHITKYCHGCGAMMDGGNEDG